MSYLNLYQFFDLYINYGQILEMSTVSVYQFLFITSVVVIFSTSVINKNKYIY